MEKQIAYQALIDKYLRDETFSEAEQNNWDQWQSEPDFTDLLTYNHDLMLALKKKGREALKAELAGLQEIQQKAESNIRSMRLMWVGVAIAAALCLLWLIIPSQEQSSPMDLYASYYERFPNVANPLTRDSGAIQSLKDRAYAKYEQGGYQQAILLFDSLLLEQPSLTHEFYKGICAMEVENWPLAQSSLQVVASSDTSRFAQAAQWYIALVDLRTDSLDSSKDNLETIASDAEHPFQQEAADLLQQID